MTIAMPMLLWFVSHGQFTFGGAKPVPVITRNFRNFRRGDLIVSAPAIVTNFVLALVCTAVFVRRSARSIGSLGGVGTSTSSIRCSACCSGAFSST